MFTYLLLSKVSSITIFPILGINHNKQTQNNIKQIKTKHVTIANLYVQLNIYLFTSEVLNLKLTRIHNRHHMNNIIPGQFAYWLRPLAKFQHPGTHQEVAKLNNIHNHMNDIYMWGAVCLVVSASCHVVWSSNPNPALSKRG